jgi:hypothetical protein
MFVPIWVIVAGIIAYGIWEWRRDVKKHREIQQRWKEEYEADERAAKAIKEESRQLQIMDVLADKVREIMEQRRREMIPQLKSKIAGVPPSEWGKDLEYLKIKMAYDRFENWSEMDWEEMVKDPEFVRMAAGDKELVKMRRALNAASFRTDDGTWPIEPNTRFEGREG